MTKARAPDLLGRWVGWRLRVVMAVALAECLVIFAFLRWLPTRASKSAKAASGQKAQLTVGSQRKNAKITRHSASATAITTRSRQPTQRPSKSGARILVISNVVTIQR